MESEKKIWDWEDAMTCVTVKNISLESPTDQSPEGVGKINLEVKEE